jgi:hypothetical protein
MKAKRNLLLAVVVLAVASAAGIQSANATCISAGGMGANSWCDEGAGCGGWPNYCTTVACSANGNCPWTHLVNQECVPFGCWNPFQGNCDDDCLTT